MPFLQVRNRLSTRIPRPERDDAQGDKSADVGPGLPRRINPWHFGRWVGTLAAGIRLIAGLGLCGPRGGISRSLLKRRRDGGIQRLKSPDAARAEEQVSNLLGPSGKCPLLRIPFGAHEFEISKE